MLNNIIRHWHFSFHTRCALAVCCPHAVVRIYEIVKFFHIIFEISLCRHNVFSLILLPLSVSVDRFLCLSLDLIHRLRYWSFSISICMATFKTRPKTLLSLFMNAQNGILMLFETRTILYFLYFFLCVRLERSIFSELFSCTRGPNSTEFHVSHLNMGFYCRSEENKICVRVCVEIAFHVSANELRVRIAWMLTATSSFSLFFSLVLCVIVRVFFFVHSLMCWLHTCMHVEYEMRTTKAFHPIPMDTFFFLRCQWLKCAKRDHINIWWMTDYDDIWTRVTTSIR